MVLGINVGNTCVSTIFFADFVLGLGLPSIVTFDGFQHQFMHVFLPSSSLTKVGKPVTPWCGRLKCTGTSLFLPNGPNTFHPTVGFVIFGRGVSSGGLASSTEELPVSMILLRVHQFFGRVHRIAGQIARTRMPSNSFMFQGRDLASPSCWGAQTFLRIC